MSPPAVALAVNELNLDGLFNPLLGRLRQGELYNGGNLRELL